LVPEVGRGPGGEEAGRVLPSDTAGPQDLGKREGETGREKSRDRDRAEQDRVSKKQDRDEG
jgi:hypothetical protein